jgi:hypothetical protein
MKGGNKMTQALYSQRCSKCGGLIYGQIERTDDFLCKCPEFLGESPKEEQPQLQGWECPRCHKIHSPFVSTCDCLPAIYTFSIIKKETK